MSIINGFTPLPNWYITQLFDLKLTHRDFRLSVAIGTEIFRFPETRENLSKELSVRFLSSLTGIHFSHVSRALKRFEKMNLIKVVRSYAKGQGSIIKIVAPIATGNSPVNDELVAPAATDITLQNNKSVAITVTHFNTSVAIEATKKVAPTATNPINSFKNLSDIKNQICPPMISSPDDDVTAIDKREEEKTNIEKILKAIEEWEQKEKPLNHSSNSLPPAVVNQSSSKQSPINPLPSSIPANSINTVYNYNVNKAIDIKPVPPAPTAPVTVQGNRQVTAPAAEESKNISAPSMACPPDVRRMSAGCPTAPPASSRVQAPTAPVPQVRGNSPSDRKKKEFSSIGSVMAETYPDITQELPERLPVLNYSMNIPNIPGVSTDNVIAGVKILKEKNLNDKDITAVFERIIKAMKAGNVLVFKRGKYFLNACSNEPEKDLPPVKTLDEQDKIIEAIYNGYETGKIKYVLSNEGERKKIIEMNKHHFIYWNGRQPQGMYFKDMKERCLHLLDMRYFVGD